MDLFYKQVYRHQQFTPSQTGSYVYGGFIVPHAYAAAVFLVLPVMRLRESVLEKRRRNVNGCARCGYDLRATPYLCPECGTRQ